MKKIFVFLINITVLSFLIGGCSPKASDSLEFQGSSPLMTPPKQGTSALRSQLSRYRGQTEFLTAQRVYGVARAESGVAFAGAGAAPRAEQESDVFKVGKTGSKLLYLLNNYRGLQVVSYKDGIESPKLLGRAEPTGNYPSDMYLDPAQDRLFVLERVWFDSQNQKYTQNQSRILVYDVANPEEPTLTEKLDIKGEIADSRMVGSVLYVVSTLRPDIYSYAYNPTISNSQGIVSSFDLSGSKISKIQELNLTLPAVYGTNLRVVTVPEGDSYKYYLLAHLSEHGWGWWDRKSLVQVVDISDDKGRITPIMTVSVKGTIQRPHQMQVKNNTLIVVSNYSIEGAPTTNNPAPRIGRIAVETFTFPTKQSEILSENEAELRRLYIEKQVKMDADKGLDSEKSRQKWTTDNTWGISGRFVNVKDQVRKLLPDSAVTTGDATGLSANLQDVRVDGDKLYAFWVPANQIDPLDLFDISAPEKGVRHIQRLAFEGWISRAEPLSYKGKSYVIGLGWIVPAVNNENNKRYAQVKLFEITSDGRSAKAIEVSSLVLSSSQFWANFNGEDKKIEFRPGSDGKGEILFEGSRADQSGNGFSTFQEGGQIISFDLAQRDSEKIFKEGPFLVGDSSWLRRVFSNSEINRINTFSDTSLVTFGPRASLTVQAVNVLELARNIKAYITFENQGLQIISEGNPWLMSGNERTILRGVSKNNVDAEKKEALNEVSLAGGHVAHLLVGKESKALLVLTSKMVYSDKKYTQTYQLHHVSLGSDKKLKTLSSMVWEPKAEAPFYIQVVDSAPSASGMMSLVPPRGYGYSSGTFLTLPSGSLVMSVGGELKKISMDKSTVEISDIRVDECNLNKDTQVEIKSFGSDEIYLFKKTPVSTEKEFKNAYASVFQNELALIKWDENKLTCGKFWSVPGEVIAFDGKTMMTSDSWVNDIYPQKGPDSEYDVLNVVTSLTSLKISKSEKGMQVRLVDMMEMPANELSYLTLPKSYSQNLSLMKYKSKERNVYLSSAELQVVSSNEEGFLTQEVYKLPETIEYGNLAKVFADSKNSNLFYGVVKSWRQVQVIKFQADHRPSIVPLAPIDWKNKKQKPVSVASILEGYSSSSDAIHFTEEQKSIEISSGLFGIQQFFLEE